MQNLVKQLNEIYLYEEDYYEEKFSEEEITKHHEKMLEAERIIFVEDGDRIAGYVEFFINNGCCFINDLFIRPAYRNTKVIWMLKTKLFEACGKSRVYFGERYRYKLKKRFPETQLRRIHE